MRLPWFAGKVCVGLHPRREGSPPARCTESHLSHKKVQTIHKCVHFKLQAKSTVKVSLKEQMNPTTDHMPRCPLVFHMGPSSVPLARDILEFQQILSKIRLAKIRWERAACFNVKAGAWPLNLRDAAKVFTCFLRAKRPIQQPFTTGVNTIFSPNHACCSPCTSMAKPKSASLTAAPFILLARSRFSGCNKYTHHSFRPSPLGKLLISLLKPMCIFGYCSKSFKMQLIEERAAEMNTKLLMFLLGWTLWCFEAQVEITKKTTYLIKRRRNKDASMSAWVDELQEHDDIYSQSAVIWPNRRRRPPLKKWPL